MFCDFFMPIEPLQIRDGVISRPVGGVGNILVCCRAPHDGDGHLVETPENRLELEGPLDAEASRVLLARWAPYV